MATSQVASSVDVLTARERKFVHDSLALKRLSVIRAVKSATNDVIRSEYEKESSEIYALMVKFS